jgi:O-6-methylguanine DNA methyltransferase
MQAYLLETVIYYDLLEAPTGDLVGVAADNQAIVRIAVGVPDEWELQVELMRRFACECARKPRHPPVREATRQLVEYLLGFRRDFDLPVRLHGTPFQLRVWRALKEIPYGETCTYAEVARAVGNPSAARAVGAANAANPVAIVIPCHRVIQSDGRLGGYGGGLRLKQFLLDLERCVSAARPLGPSARSRRAPAP